MQIGIYPFGLYSENLDDVREKLGEVVAAIRKNAPTAEIEFVFPKDTKTFQFKKVEKGLSNAFKNVSFDQYNESDVILNSRIAFVFPQFEDFEGEGQFTSEQIDILNMTDGAIYVYPKFGKGHIGTDFTDYDLYDPKRNIKAKVLSFGALKNLKNLAQTLKLKGYSKMKKDDLVELLRDEDFNIVDFIARLSSANQNKATKFLESVKTQASRTLEDLEDVISFSDLCSEDQLVAFKTLDPSKKSSYPGLKSVGLSPTLLTEKEIKAALEELGETKLPNYVEILGVKGSDLCHIPTFWHAETSEADLKLMAKAIYDIEAKDVEGDREKALRKYLLRFIPSPSLLATEFSEDSPVIYTMIFSTGFDLTYENIFEGTLLDDYNYPEASEDLKKFLNKDLFGIEQKKKVEEKPETPTFKKKKWSTPEEVERLEVVKDRLRTLNAKKERGDLSGDENLELKSLTVEKKELQDKVRLATKLEQSQFKQRKKGREAAKRSISAATEVPIQEVKEAIQLEDVDLTVLDDYPALEVIINSGSLTLSEFSPNRNVLAFSEAIDVIGEQGVISLIKKLSYIVELQIPLLPHNYTELIEDDSGILGKYYSLATAQFTSDSRKGIFQNFLLSPFDEDQDPAISQLADLVLSQQENEDTKNILEIQGVQNIGSDFGVIESRIPKDLKQFFISIMDNADTVIVPSVRDTLIVDQLKGVVNEIDPGIALPLALGKHTFVVSKIEDTPVVEYFDAYNSKYYVFALDEINEHPGLFALLKATLTADETKVGQVKPRQLFREGLDANQVTPFEPKQWTKASDIEKKRGGGLTRTTKSKLPEIRVEAELAVKNDPFQRKDELDPRVVILPCWDYSDIRSYISSYAKNLGSQNLREALKGLLLSLSYNTSGIIDAWENLISAAEDVNANASFVDFLFEAPEPTSLKLIDAILPNPLSLTEYPSEDNSYFSGFSISFEDVDGEYELMVQNIGSGVLISDMDSGDENSDPGLFIYIPFLRDVFQDYRYINTPKGGKLKIAHGKVDFKDESEFFAKMDAIFTSLQKALVLAQSRFEGYLAERDFDIDEGFAVRGDFEMPTTPRVILPERALAPRNPQMKDGSFYDFFDEYVSDISDEGDIELTGIQNPITVLLTDSGMPYELLGQDSFSYDARVGSAPLVKDVFKYPMGWQDTYGLNSNLYLASWSEQQSLFGILERRKRTSFAYFKPTYAIEFPRQLLNAKVLTRKVGDLGVPNYFSIAEGYRIGGNRKKDVYIKGANRPVKFKDAVRTILNTKSYPLEIGIAATEPSTMTVGSKRAARKQGKEGKVDVEVQDKAFLTTVVFDTNPKGQTILPDETKDDLEGLGIDPNNITILPIRKKFLDSFELGDDPLLRGYQLDNHDINSSPRRLNDELFKDPNRDDSQKTRKDLNQYNRSLSLRSFFAQPKGKGEDEYVPSVRTLTAPIIPVWRVDEKYNDQVALHSQFFYSSFERRLRNFVTSEDAQYVDTVVFDYNDFKDFTEYRRKPGKGKTRTYKGPECLIELTRMFLINRGVEVIILNLPREIFSNYSSKEYKEFTRTAVDIQSRQLKGENIIFQPKKLEDNNVAFIMGVIGGGANSSFTFTMGNYPKYMLDFESNENLLREFKKRGLDYVGDGVDILSSRFAPYFFAEDDRGTTMPIPFMLSEEILKQNPDIEQRLNQENINPNNVLKGVRPSMGVYAYLEKNILNDLDILQSLEMYAFKDEKGRVLRDPIPLKETPFKATKADWDAYNEENKTYKRSKEITRKSATNLDESIKVGAQPFENEVDSFVAESNNYINLLDRTIDQLIDYLGENPDIKGTFDLPIAIRNELGAALSSFKIIDNKSLDQTVNSMERAQLFLTIKRLDGLVNEEDNSSELVEIMPFEVKEEYVVAKLEFSEALIRKIDDLKERLRRSDGATTLARDIIDSRLSELETWTRNTLNEAQLQQQEINKGLRDMREMIDKSFVRKISKLKIPKPPKGFEPRLSLFAITNDGSCFKISRVRGKIAKVNEYPFYLASDALNPLNVMMGALLVPPSAGTKLADVAIAAFSTEDPTVREIKRLGRSAEAEKLAQKHLAGALKAVAKKLGKDDGAEYTNAAQKIESDNRLAQVQTAIGMFGGRFRRIFDDQKKDFFTNTPSMQRYIDTYLNDLKRKAENAILNGSDVPPPVVIDALSKGEKNGYVLVKENLSVEDIREIKETPKDERDVFTVVSRRVPVNINNPDNPLFVYGPQQGPAFKIIDGSILPLREYELNRYLLALRWERAVQNYLKQKNSQILSPFENCVLKPALNAIPASIGGQGLIDRAKGLRTKRQKGREEVLHRF